MPPIFFPAGEGGAGAATALRYVYSAAGNVRGVNVGDAIFSNVFNQFCLFERGSGFVLYGTDMRGPFNYSSTGIGSTGTLVRGAELDGRLYRIRLGNTIATAVRSTDDLVTWQTDFGGIIINDADYNADHILLATNYVAGGPNNGVLFDGVTWANIYSGNPVNASACLLTPSGRIVFGFAAGILRYSDDNGNNWTEVNLGVAGSDGNVNRLYKSSGGILFAALNGGRIFESQDDGATWNDGFPALQTALFTSPIAFSGTDTIQVYGAGGFIGQRVGPAQWRGEASPTLDAFIGSLRYDTLNIGFTQSYSVAQL